MLSSLTKPVMYTKLTKAILGLLISLFISAPIHAQERITVFAASSLTNALTDIGKTFQQTHPAIKPVFSFASSSTLARQIAQGAPADIYLSANQKWMNYLLASHAVNSKTALSLLKNELVVIAPKNSGIQQLSINNDLNLADIIKDSRLAVGDPDHVPAGLYAKQALTHYALWEKVSPLLARANNARSALALVERGESPLGIVYATDAKVANNVKTVAIFPTNSHNSIEYPMVMVKDDKHISPATHAFYRYLQGDEANNIFREYGFQVITH